MFASRGNLMLGALPIIGMEDEDDSKRIATVLAQRVFRYVEEKRPGYWGTSFVAYKTRNPGDFINGVRRELIDSASKHLGLVVLYSDNFIPRHYRLRERKPDFSERGLFR